MPYGLHVGTGRLEDNVHLDVKDRLGLVLVCKSSQHVEDEHLPALYSLITARHACCRLLLCHNVLLGVNKMHVMVL